MLFKENQHFFLPKIIHPLLYNGHSCVATFTYSAAIISNSAIYRRDLPFCLRDWTPIPSQVTSKMDRMTL